MRLTLMLLCAVISCSTIAAQKIDSCAWSITGQVIDDHDGTPLEYANIYVMETGRGVGTDSLGYFRMEGACTGSYTLRATHIGCDPVQKTVNVKGNTDVIIRLEHHSEVLDAIVLTARRTASASSVSREVVDRQVLSSNEGRALGESLRSLPGVNAIQTGPAIFKPVIHGFHSNRVLIINDGIRQEGQQWGLDHAPEIDPFLANRVTVVKGTAAVQYGSDAVAGVILVEHDTLPINKSLSGRAALYGMTNGWQGGASALLEKGLGNGFGIRWHGTVKRGGDRRAPDYQLTNTGVRELNTSITAGYRRGLTKVELSYNLFTTEIGILRSAHIGNLTDLEEALERGEPFYIEPFSYAINNPRQRVQHHLVKVNAQRFIPGAGLLSGFYGFQFNRRQEYDIRRGGRDDIPALDLELASQVAELRLAHEDFLGLRGNIAAHWIYKKNANVPGTGVRPLIPNYQFFSPGLSVIEKWIRGDFEVEGGLRYEYQYLEVKRFDDRNELKRHEMEYNNLSTSLGVNWMINDRWTVNANAGATNRAPNVNELFSEGLHHGAAAIEEGDSTLTPERAIKLIAGVEYNTPRVQGQVSVYSQFIEDFIYLRPDGEPRLTIRGAFPVFRYVQNNARTWGIDAAFRIGIVESVALESKYSMVRATNTDENQPLIFMPADRMSHTLLWEEKNGRFNAGITFDYVWEQTRAPEGLDYAPPPDAYALFQLNFGTRLTVNENPMEASFTISNLLNTRYREYLNRLRYFADDVGRNIELRLNYTF